MNQTSTHSDQGGKYLRRIPAGAPPVGQPADCGPDCDCSGLPESVTRREFLKVAAAGAAAAGVSGCSIMAGPFGKEDLTGDMSSLMPQDKKLAADWVRSLYEKGEKEVWSGDGIDAIGMPCSGIGTGQLYLCGDGTLGSWQIFNNTSSEWIPGTHATYKRREPAKPVEQGFAVVLRERGGRESVWPLNRHRFKHVAFKGEYPIATINYSDPDCPVEVEMEGFSPFIPMDTANSTLPGTLFHIRVRNTSGKKLGVAVVGWLENAVGQRAAQEFEGLRRTRYERHGQARLLQHSAANDPNADAGELREKIVFDDFEHEDWGDWTVEGDAFGSGPVAGSIKFQSWVSNYKGARLVNSYHNLDAGTGKLTSPEFTIERKYINFLVGGGGHADTCIELVVDGEVRREARGENSEVLRGHSWFVEELEGRKARIVIRDEVDAEWGHILVDDIAFADEPLRATAETLPQSPDFGTLALIVAEGAEPSAAPALELDIPIHLQDAEFALKERGLGLLSAQPRTLESDEECRADFALAWHFPNHQHGHEYAARFLDAAEVCRYLSDRDERLSADTRLWRDTLYDSTLPWWLLDRLSLTICCLATGTFEYWANGRFWGWEGVACCPGTCTHVWNYAHSHARLFPSLARNIRERQDLMFNTEDPLGGLHPETGLVGFRHDDNYAADGQVGTVLKAYREHLCSADDRFLRRNWDKIKLVLDYSIEQDENADGLIENTQHNTYDVNYFGANTFVGSLYLAALRAAEEMALEMGDTAYAEKVRNIFEQGSRNTVERLWNGEYFIQDVDLEEHPVHQYGQGCLSDQVFGQGWCHQVGLGYIYPEDKVLQTLRSVWRYNWQPDVGPYNEKHEPFRWFIAPGQAGLLTCTWPHSEYLPEGTAYKNEVWTGIEYQVAGHMIAEGMMTEGLAICRAIHDRYQPEIFNPYNEVECGDHYARAMASWGVYHSLAGFHYHGPQGLLRFAPRLTPEDYRAALTFAEGWGTMEQQRRGSRQTQRLTLRYGSLRLARLEVALEEGHSARNVSARLDGKKIALDSADKKDGMLALVFDQPLEIRDGQTLEVDIRTA